MVYRQIYVKVWVQNSANVASRRRPYQHVTQLLFTYAVERFIFCGALPYVESPGTVQNKPSNDHCLSLEGTHERACPPTRLAGVSRQDRWIWQDCRIVLNLDNPVNPDNPVVLSKNTLKLFFD